MDHEVIFQNAPVGICSIRERVFLRCNKRFEELFGYKKGELENKSLRLLYPTEELFKYIGETYGHFFEKHSFYTDERPLVRKDGKLIWCILTGKVLDPSNPKLGAIWAVQDISEHKRLEDGLRASVEKLELMVQQRTLELRKHISDLNLEVATRKKAEDLANESQQKYQNLFHMLPIGISVTDAKGRILESNRVFDESVQGSGASSATNWRKFPVEFSWHDGTRIPQAHFPWILNGHQKDSVRNIEVGMRKKGSGKWSWMNVSCSSLSLKNQPMVVTAFSDITYRKRIEQLERLRYAETTRLGRINSMAEMATALAHQMGQPLIAALNYLHGCRLRLERKADIDEIAGSVGLAIKYLEQAGEILRRVRDFVCKHDPDKQPEDINEVIRDTLSFLDFEIRRHKVSVKLDLAKNLPPVPLCKVEIQQVLFNLLKNGMEAMASLPEPERVLVVGNEMGSEGRELTVFVRDHGKGVEPEDVKRVFDPMFSTKPEGMGVGLTICRCIVESHGGQLFFSRNRKRGSKFTFTLPM